MTTHADQAVRWANEASELSKRGQYGRIARTGVHRHRDCARATRAAPGRREQNRASSARTMSGKTFQQPERKHTVSKSTKWLARQGDVLLERVAAIPAAAKKRETTRVVLAEGETTGHRHVVTGPAELFDADRQTYLRVGEGAAVQHEEHSTIALPPGEYRVTIQSEYTPANIRNVQD